jgi:25S rRNA (cytosine2278-C5)-methyltransferase
MLNEMWKRRVSLKSLAFSISHSSSAKGSRDPSGNPSSPNKGNGGSGRDISSSGSGVVATLACSKTTYAQASNVLRYKSELDAMFERHRDQLEGAANRGLLYVLLYELLEGPNRAIRGGGSVKRMLMKVEADLRSDWDDLVKERRKRAATEGEDHDNDDDGASVVVAHPRYVRVNTLLATKASIVKALDELTIPWKDDGHVPDLLVVPTRDADTTCRLVELAPRVIMQDKSSCFPALCLVHGYETPLAEGDCIDACAAPGNKTLHLAALLASATSASASNNSNNNNNDARTAINTVHAFDKDPRRCRDLKRRVVLHARGAAPLLGVRVKVECLDFLSLEPNDYPTVRAILLDPTCSGSGTVAGVERRGGHDDDDALEHRIQSLSRFQCTALRHAMSFPNCERIVYSTCSIYDAENELVMADALRPDPEQVDQEWTVVPPRCLSGWARRGRNVAGLTQEQASALIRVDPNEDDTGGFFVACLERRRMSSASAPEVSSTSTGNKKKRAASPPGPSLLEAPVTTKRPKRGSRAPGADARVGAEGTADVAATIEESHRQTAKRRRASSSVDRLPGAKTGEATNKKRLKKLQWKQKQREEKQRRLQEPKAT